MRYAELLHEGRVYQIDWGYPRPVTITSNPSPPQARTMVALLDHRDTMYFRGLMVRKTVYIWDGWMMTHDDVRTELLHDIPESSDDLTTFEIADYTPTGLMKVQRHEAKLRVLKSGPDPATSPFVRNVMMAIDAARGA